jgi:outer membrane protein OmpA-like peptidoglycan-associated protein
VTLPTSGRSDDLSLPTIAGGSGDTVNISTTTVPTTTTTIPPPVIPSDVLFDTDQATLKPEATPYLQTLAAQINERHPGARLNFVGHTDSRGSTEYNADLSLRRAEAVLNWFATNGFDRGRLTAEGAGESRLLVPDTDEAGLFIEDAGSQNRRVEIQIL